MAAFLMVCAVVVLVALSGTALYYTAKVKEQEKNNKAVQEKQQQAWRAKREELANDVRFIANAVVQEQCEITEGCLRMKVLMDKLDEELQHKPEFQGIQMFYKLTQDMPTHQAYKDLKRKEQFKLDQARYKLEDEHRALIMKEAKTLAHYQFEILNPH